MKSNYDILGNHIRLIDTRNRESITDRVLGINIDKFFMPSVANVIGTDLSKYKLITKGKFACNPMHVGRDERLPVALYDEDTPALVSPAYFMFEVIDDSLLNEDYLMMWFRRPEFDRICWLHTDGSVRGGITWDDICRLELPIPPIEKQLEIVNSYKAITERIALKQKINDNLEATLSALYKEFFTITSSDELPFGWRVAPFSDIAAITMGQSPQGDDCNNNGVGEPLLNGPTEFGFYSPSPMQWTTNGKKHCVEGDLLFCVRGSTTGRMNWANQSYAIGRGLAAIHHKSDCTLNWFVKAMIDNSLQEILSAATGSTFPNVGKDLLNGFQVIIPDDNSLREFGVKGHSIFSMISNNAKEIDVLVGLQRTLLSKLTI
ncbi:restriction endonuclease subunit S [Dorea sp. 210702-DFI.3.125]|uniref:restriction endonuclease subunit S n=1 Tax=Dorea sp. 210702-DFI.3.125 TaxID=2883207 RepID=UPI001D06A17B|nr:restriction endonuclease subunit S [Dorea sp. 210702-DFI.3.125]MCB6509074.1 restriction endonuclease subunit S [Dorea sp. 210702-DFI.3.125]